MQREPPEFLAAEDARDRLARLPPGRERGERVGFRGREEPLAGGSKPGMVEAERMANQQAGVELGRVDTLRAQALRKQAAGRGDGDVGLHVISSRAALRCRDCAFRVGLGERPRLCYKPSSQRTSRVGTTWPLPSSSLLSPP